MYGSFGRIELLLEIELWIRLMFERNGEGMKKIKYFVALCLSFLCMGTAFAGCGSKNHMKDGFYTAEMSEYSHGWKEYLCIMVKDDKIVYAEFNAKDASGYIKAWDNAYMENMVGVTGTYPNEYTRKYVASLMENQSPEDVDGVTGATNSGSNFAKLSAAVVEQAKKGDANITIVE